MSVRVDLRQFAIANPLYAGAHVFVHEVDGDFKLVGNRLAPVYAALTGNARLPNPLQLDGHGKWQQPPYVDRPVILRVGGGKVQEHTTAVTGQLFGWRGDWAPNTVYNTGHVVRDGSAGTGTENLYIATAPHTSSALFSADRSQGKWAIYVDMQAAAQSVVTQAVTQSVAAANATVDQRIAELMAGAGNVPPPAGADVGRFLRATGVGAGQYAWFSPVVNDLADATPIGINLVKAATAQSGRTAIGAASSEDLTTLANNAMYRDGSTAMTGNLTVLKDAPSVRLNSPTPSTRLVRFQTNGQDRFAVGASSAAESGGSLGSNFFMRRYLDDGTGDDVLVVERNTGRVRIEGSLPLRLPAQEPTDLNDAARKAYVDRFRWSESGTLNASGSATTLTGLPAGIREIIINFHLVTSNGTEPMAVQLGTAASGFAASGYLVSSVRVSGAGVAPMHSSLGFAINTNSPGGTMSGFMHLTRFGPGAPNTWQAIGMLTFDVAGALILTTGYLSLATSPIDRLRIICLGNDVFDGGAFNVMWRE